MRGLRKILTPFAPDQSGAVSVLYSLGGIVIILDAGGCAGNICGFDEPRWAGTRSAIFSAGLRDMDAVMGRDRLLIKKTINCVRRLDVSFVAFVGTPVPAVIGTDFSALKRMLEKRLAELSLPPLPVFSIPTDGMHSFDRGERMAYEALLSELSEKKLFSEKEPDAKRVGLFGATPLDLPDYSNDRKRISEALRREGFEKSLFYGADAALSDYEEASLNALNIALSEDGVSSCRYLQKKFGTPYRVGFPGAEDYLKGLPDRAENILILHSPVFARSLGEAIKKERPGSRITVASWFDSPDPEVRRLVEEDDLPALAAELGPDTIIGDEILKKLLQDFKGTFLPVAEFALSGKRVA